jgi:hypothetical protein
MGNSIVKAIVRAMFAVTSRARAIQQTERYLGGYTRLAEGVTAELGRRSVTVPPMPGVDDDMRSWSFFMILDHNTIVNQSITTMIQQLVRGEPLSGAAVTDMKTGVLPSPTAGQEAVAAFRDSVKAHLTTMDTLGRLRGSRRSKHIRFGDFDAHQWNCMFAFHLRLHYKQANHVVQALRSAQAGCTGP